MHGISRYSNIVTGDQKSNKKNFRINFEDLETEEDTLWDPDNYETLHNLTKRACDVKIIEKRSEKILH